MNDFENKSLQEMIDMSVRIKFLVFHGHLDEGLGQIITNALNKAIAELEDNSI